MPDADNPMLFGTQKDYAWNAWQTAYGAGNGTGADRAEFDAWWERIAAQPSGSIRALMAAAWQEGDRSARMKAPTFDAWWQQIIDTQPKVTP